MQVKVTLKNEVMYYFNLVLAIDLDIGSNQKYKTDRF